MLRLSSLAPVFKKFRVQKDVIKFCEKKYSMHQLDHYLLGHIIKPECWDCRECYRCGQSQGHHGGRTYEL